MFKRSVVCCFIFVLCLGVGVAYSADQTQYQNFLNSKVCTRCDLSSVTFPHKDYSGAYFDHVTLSYSSLGGNFASATFDSCTLTSTKFPLANLQYARFFGSSAQNAFLGGANLTGASLLYSDFTNATFQDANLTGANISNSTLTGANFSNAIWTNGVRCKPGSIGKCLQ